MRGGVKSFAIRSGTCHVYSDRIEIQQSDVPGILGRWFFARGIHSSIGLYVLMALVFAGSTLVALLLPNYFLAFFLGLFTLLALFLVIFRRRTSFVPIISRKLIEQATYHKAQPGVSRARFEIWFRPKEGGPILLRRLSLPHQVHQGSTLADTAYWIMRDEGLVE